MSCVCIKCEKPCDCGEEYCEEHLIEECARKNLDVGGRFYGEKLLKDKEVQDGD